MIIMNYAGLGGPNRMNKLKATKDNCKGVRSQFTDQSKHLTSCIFNSQLKYRKSLCDF